ncbi:MAG: LamG domain-containing protein [Candidatus Pacebacteria bacterium]|nr:LamG domain-containing protein [Candidatus Paceibacterota bacterium]MDD5555062.1 LamG domain-containing protein [Candidatus Paceibacterota bacterium]
MNKSFTLIEILVVIVIIGILSAFIIVSMAGVSSKATIAKGQAFSSSLKNALLLNMITQYKLDGDASDSWGSHTTGTVNGASSYSSCIQSTCYNFDGIDDYIELVDSYDLRMTTGGTISVWIYPRTLGEASAGRVIDKSTSTTGANGYCIFLVGSNAIAFRINAEASYLNSSSDAITLNQWQLVTVTFNAAGRKIYVNGVDKTASGGSLTALPPDIAGVVTIGNRAGATDRTFDGYIDEVRIYNMVVPSSQIQQNYYSGLSRLSAKNQVDFEEYRAMLAELKESLVVDK